MKMLAVLAALAFAAAPLAAAGVTTTQTSTDDPETPCTWSSAICTTIIVPDVVWPDGSTTTFEPIIINGYR